MAIAARPVDFFARQDRTRAVTRRLVVLLVIATAILVAAVNWVAGTVAGWVEGTGRSLDGFPLHAVVTLGTVALVGVLVWMKARELRYGGPALAVMLGGREVLPGTREEEERRLRNVVEEMAIAAGVPTPAVFVLPSFGINAFAAGHGLNDTAIAVTRGSLRLLPRDELQALVAHETSHLLNGDAQINLRLLSLVHGLLGVTHLGRMLVHMDDDGDDDDDTDYFVYRPPRRNRDGTWALRLGIGGFLIVVGWLGWLLSNLVRAGISRQREYLADAAAVQFTRNPRAVTRVLRRILHPAVGSTLAHPQVELASHLLFAHPATGWFSTHPPLAERIRALDPQWDGTPLGPEPETAVEKSPAATAPATTRIGVPATVDFASRLLGDLPDLLTGAAGDPFTARAVVLVLLAVPEAGIARALAGDPLLLRVWSGMRPAWATQDSAVARLPLLHLALPALHRLGAAQTADFLAVLGRAVRDGQPIDRLLERLVRAHLAPTAAPVTFTSWKPVTGDVLRLLRVVAWQSGDPAGSLAAAWDRLLIPGPRPAAEADPGLDALGGAFDRLLRTPPALRRRLADAIAHGISADGRVEPGEAEVARVACELLGMPLPLFRDGTPVVQPMPIASSSSSPKPR